MGFLYSFGKEIPSALKLRQHYLHVQNALAEFGENTYFQLCLTFCVLLLFYFFIPYPTMIELTCKLFVSLISVFKLSLN